MNHNNLVAQYRTIEFALGLIFLGFIGILINFYINLNDIISVCLLVLGITIFIFFSLQLESKNKKTELIFIFLIIILSTFLSFYSLSNDDFDYHFQTIKYFKELKLFDIEHGRRTSYNSHWLLINALFYLTKFPESVFCISSLLYTLIIFDFYRSFKKNYSSNNYLPTIYSVLVLFFLIGVMSKYKNFGIDFPGQIIILFVFDAFLNLKIITGIINNIK